METVIADRFQSSGNLFVILSKNISIPNINIISILNIGLNEMKLGKSTRIGVPVDYY